MRITITGGAGFIGSHLTEALREQGHEVTIIDNLGVGSNDVVLKWPDVKIYPCDITKWVDLSGQDMVYHLAAESHVDRSLIQVDNTWNTNVMGTVAVLESARRGNIPMIHVATDEVYGETKSPVREDAPFNPTTPYATSKAAGDLACQSAFKSFGQDVRIVRPGNAYGERQLNEKVLPRIREANQNNPFTIHGDGSQRRQWTRVHDLVTALMLVAEKGSPGEAYNATSESELSIVEVLELAGNPPHEYIPDPRGSVQDWCYRLDCEKLRGLGWEPMQAEEGLRDYFGC